MITPEDYQIVLKLESNPLMSYSDLAKDLGVSWPTAKKRINDLKSRGVIRTPVAIYNFRTLGLQRLAVIWSLKTTDDLLLMEKFCDIHPYTHYRVRGYGNGYILFAQFDVPQKTIPLMKELVTALEKDYSNTVILLQSSGYRVESFPNLNYYDITQDIWYFDWTEWLDLFNDQPETLPSQDHYETIDLTEFKPIDFEILREVTKNPGIKQVDLMHQFNLTRTNAHLKYNSVFKNLISSVRARFDRILFDLVNTRVFWIPNPNEKNTNKLFNLIKHSPPPFRFGLDILQPEGCLFWGGDLPNYHEHQLAFSIWKLFQTFNTYTLDISVNTSMIYWFYPNNFDFGTHYWKTDREYVVEKPLEELHKVKKKSNS